MSGELTVTPSCLKLNRELVHFIYEQFWEVPHYVESFVDDGDVDMAEIVRMLCDKGFDGITVPDHVRSLDCPAPWHAGHAYTAGFIRALTTNARVLGPARSQEGASFEAERQAVSQRQ